MKSIRSTVASPVRMRQQGVVMIVALLLLGALTLAGVALVRSVSTSNVVAGNLAFRQASTRSADQGIETAIAWIGGQPAATLYDNATGNAYLASRTDPPAGTSWATFFDTTLTATGAVQTMAPDAAGNTVSYVIQRLCSGVGAPGDVDCAQQPKSRSTCSQGSSCSGGGDSMLGAGGRGPSAMAVPVYYRITARSDGPRSTRSYVQAIVSF